MTQYGPKIELELIALMEQSEATATKMRALVGEDSPHVRFCEAFDQSLNKLTDMWNNYVNCHEPNKKASLWREAQKLMSELKDASERFQQAIKDIC
jgi:hypothetical protein